LHTILLVLTTLDSNISYGGLTNNHPTRPPLFHTSLYVRKLPTPWFRNPLPQSPEVEASIPVTTLQIPKDPKQPIKTLPATPIATIYPIANSSILYATMMIAMVFWYHSFWTRNMFDRQYLRHFYDVLIVSTC
jgi:hypothetical protein